MSSSLDRRKAPTPKKARPFRFPDFERVELSDGVVLWDAPWAGTQLTLVDMLFRGGGHYAHQQPSGLASFTSGMLDEGTSSRSASEIALAVEKYGGGLGSGCDWESSSLGIGILTRHLTEGLEVMADVFHNATFPESEIERLRGQRLAELERRRLDPSALASTTFARKLYEDTPYGTLLLGTKEGVSSLQAEDLKRFSAQALLGKGTNLIAVGDHDRDEVRQFLQSRFPSLGSQARPSAEIPAAKKPEGLRVTVVDRPEAQQTELRVGHPGPRRTAVGRTDRIVMNQILGGKFTSRINLNLREKNGYTYGASSGFSDRRGPGPFVVGTAVNNEATVAATREILFELKRIQESKVSVEELDDARNYLLGVFPYGLQTMQGLASCLESLAVHELPLDYFDTTAERVSAVTQATVQEAAQQHLDADHCHVIAVGPAKDLIPEFAELEGAQVEAVDPLT